MAPLEAATQHARVYGRKKGFTRSRGGRGEEKNSANSAAPRETSDSFCSLALACWVAGSGPAMELGDAHTFLAFAIDQSASGRRGRKSARLRALRHLHCDVPDLCAARR